MAVSPSDPIGHVAVMVLGSPGSGASRSVRRSVPGVLTLYFDRGSIFRRKRTGEWPVHILRERIGPCLGLRRDVSEPTERGSRNQRAEVKGQMAGISWIRPGAGGSRLDSGGSRPYDGSHRRAADL